MAARYNGTGYHQTAGNWTLPSKASVCFWLNLQNTTGRKGILGTVAAWSLIAVNDRLDHELWGRIGSPSWTGLVAGTWQHICCTADPVANQAEIFVDAKSRATGSCSGSPGAGKLTLGWIDTLIGDTRLRGDIDDVRIYDRVLTVAEIQTIEALRGRDGIDNGLLHRYTLSRGAPEVEVTKVYDDVLGIDHLKRTAGTTIYIQTLNTTRRYVGL